MQRLLAAWLLLLIGLPFVSPLLASAQETDAAIPICCRRGGAHHCLSAVQYTAASDNTDFSAPPSHCGHFPKFVAPVHNADLFLLTATRAFADDVALPSIAWQAEARARVALDRARRKRGPPAPRLS